MHLTTSQIRQFRSMMFSWWKTNKRDLPWRHTRDPYKIAVSEIMLQQTQVVRVIPKYREFIKRYPTVSALAKVSSAEVLRAWKGMGYNRRALYLHKLAKMVVQEHRGKFPKDLRSLTKLPGLGIYTARAILVFAYKKNVACVDTNIRQIIIHFFFHDNPQSPKIIQSIANQLLPRGKSWQWHQALMDYGSEHNSEFKIYNSKLMKHKKPFKETDRFIRGKIIDYLRERSHTKTQLIRCIAKTYQKPISRVTKIINVLADEGLIEILNGIVSLPR